MADVAHPSFTFLVNLELLSTEQIGPSTNAINPAMLHPTRHQDDQDNAVVEKSNFRTTRSTWNPGILGLNRVLKHGDTFTVTGQKAIYLRDMYAVGFAPADRAVLEIQ
jgi:hypothetical protein